MATRGRPKLPNGPNPEIKATISHKSMANLKLISTDNNESLSMTINRAIEAYINTTKKELQQ